MTEQELRTHLKAKMESVTLDTLPAFIEEALAEGNGYGEICVAIGAIAAAAAKAADRSERGGITGFQASAVFWEFQRFWGVFGDGPMRMLCYDDALYPQTLYKFQPTFSAETWKWMQERAAERLLESPDAHPNVLAHWAAIANGTLPDGFTLDDAA